MKTDGEQILKAKDFTNQRTRRAGEVDKFSRPRTATNRGACPGRACLCGGQAPVGILGALPRASEERHAGVHGALALANIYLA